MWPEGIPENSMSEDIGGGLLAWIVDGKIAHWNISVPGHWVGPYTVKRVGHYVSDYCQPTSGVYRLIGLDDSGKPASLNRICGSDQTGTLYIGREGKNFAVRSRLSKLVRSLQEPRRRGEGCSYNEEHHAGYRLRRHFSLSRRFPISHLAITWCYSRQSALAERILLDAYFREFGDTPPLNRV
jgi:hypothetical protein